MRLAQFGDLIYLVSEKDRTTFIRVLEPGEVIQTHRGVLKHDDMVDVPFGSLIRTHLDYPYYLLFPTTEEMVRFLRRQSQIVFPKDAGYIIMRLGLKPGDRVLECGTGSGGLTIALTTAVGAAGKVYSYDVREDMQNIARKNLRKVGLLERAELKQGDALEGFEETDVDALFLDIPKPWEALHSVHRALRGGGVLGCIVPTVNQLTRMIAELDAKPGFGFVEAEELLLRSYKTLAIRVRPDDRMVGHTGFLIFARAVIPAAQVASPADERDEDEDSDEEIYQE